MLKSVNSRKSIWEMALFFILETGGGFLSSLP